METGLFAALVAGAACLLVVTCVLVVVVLSGRRTQKALAVSRADVEALRARLDALADQLEASRLATAAAPAAPQTDYLITTAAESSGTALAHDTAVANRVVLSGTLGEPLLKAVAFGYAVRRALAPQTRNRIAYEMRREVKRARKRRKRDLRAGQRTAGVTDAAA